MVNFWYKFLGIEKLVTVYDDFMIYFTLMENLGYNKLLSWSVIVNLIVRWY